tara:strand:+ start:162 stop:770 length:609 start_codon:yes stop_codon:yes gene_type:complete
MGRPSLKERKKQQAAIKAQRDRSRAWNKANPKPKNKGNAAKYNEEMKVWKAKRKAFKNPTPLTATDKADAAKEAATASLLKNKPKGGYSKENTKDPGPGIGKDGKPRTATLEEDRKANAPKPKPKPENKTEKTQTTNKKKKLKINFDTTPGLAKAVKKSETETKATKEKADKGSKRKKWALMTKAQRKAAKRAEMFAKAKKK